MRILMLVPQLFYSARGTPLSAYHRVKDLQARGHEVEVLTYGVGDPPPDPSLVVHRARGPHFGSSVQQGPSWRKIYFDALLALRLVERLARGRYALLYAHEEGGFLGALLGPVFGVPLVYDMHSSLPLQIRDWGFSRSERVVALFRFVERFTLRRAAAVVSISPAVTRAALAAWPAARVVTLVNRFELGVSAGPVDRSRVRRELGIAEHERLVLYAGSFVALQNLSLLIEAVPAVRAGAPEARVALVGGRDGEMDALREQVNRLGVGDVVRILPHRPQADMPALLAASDVLVSPRVQGINPPGKLFSYLDSGRPLVATRRPIHDQILDDECAILVEPTPAAFAEGIVVALHDAERVRRTTQAAARILQERFGEAERDEAWTRLLRFVDDARRARAARSETR